MKRITSFVRRGAWWVAAIFVVSLSAQDVTHAPVAWMNPEGAPDTLPVLKRAPRVEFPSELRKTPDIGWGMVDIWLDAKGAARSTVSYATQPAYQNAIAKSGSRKFEPGSREGEAVNTRVRVTTIFNPASASTKTRDATPRLLDARCIEVRDWKRGPNDSPMTSQVAWATVTLNERGEVTGLSEAPAELLPLLEAGVREWRFAPARLAGNAVAATVRVPFILVPRDEPVVGKGEPPRVIKRTPPVYPMAMRRSGMRGDVVVEFVVDEEGSVRSPVVVRTLNPSFNEAALDAVRAWKFEPARVEGRAVKTRMQQPISFGFSDMPDGGDDGVDVRRRGRVSELPPEFRYDTAPQVAALEVPRYPYALLREGVRGSADVGMLVAANGKVTYTKIVEASRPEFGYALQAAVERFEYEPAVKDGRPTQAALRFQQKFSTNRDELLTEAENEALRIERKQPERILGANQLDGKLKPIAARAPLFPRSVDQTKGGEAEVEFIIDGEGRVVLPRVISASAPEFGYAAAQATTTWRFEPPTSGGKPAFVRARVPFTFTPPDQPLAENEPAAGK
jgi:TonB family protein